MPAHAPSAAKPTKSIFDPFNSSATGHQRAENRLTSSTSWRDSRSAKLRAQLRSGPSGGKRVSDTVGAGSLNFGRDGRTENGGFVRGAKGLRGNGQTSLWESLKVEKEKDERFEERPSKRAKVLVDDDENDANAKPTPMPTCVVNPFTPFRRQDGKIRESSWTSHECSPSDLLEPFYPIATPEEEPSPAQAVTEEARKEPSPPPPPQIFAHCNFYINGSTYPLSDHKIKHLLSIHGGKVSIALGRRNITHIILGRPNSNGGNGGGLAGSKIQKEVKATRGKAKFVTAEWITESVKAGKRLPESHFEAMKLGPSGVVSIRTMFKPKVA